MIGNDVTITQNNGTDVAAAVAAAKAADVAILMLGDQQAEGGDHAITLGNNQDALAAAVLAADPRTIVVLKSGGPLVLPWIDQAKAVLGSVVSRRRGRGGSGGGLFGVVNPSGKLPITFPKRDEGLPTSTPAQYPGVNNVAQYSEGLLVGYRWYDEKKIEPQFPFGFGLSYTTFAYKDLKVSAPTADKMVTVDLTVTNTGKPRGRRWCRSTSAYPGSRTCRSRPNS